MFVAADFYDHGQYHMLNRSFAEPKYTVILINFIRLAPLQAISAHPRII